MTTIDETLNRIAAEAAKLLDVDPRKVKAGTDYTSTWSLDLGFTLSEFQFQKLCRFIVKRAYEMPNMFTQLSYVRFFSVTDASQRTEAVVLQDREIRRRACETRRFEMHRIEDPTGVSGTGHVADGIEFADGTVAVRWRTEFRSTTFFDSIADLKAVSGHGGKTIFSDVD